MRGRGVCCVWLLSDATAATLIRQKQHKISTLLPTRCHHQIWQETAEAGVMAPRRSLWVAPAVLLKKRDGSWCFGINYRCQGHPQPVAMMLSMTLLGPGGSAHSTAHPCNHKLPATMAITKMLYWLRSRLSARRRAACLSVRRLHSKEGTDTATTPGGGTYGVGGHGFVGPVSCH